MASTMAITDPDDLAVATIRTLAMDAVQAANSGHPGTPIALAPVAYTLWQEFLRFDPEQPIWANRDRFVLSAGHASTLLYSLLHLTGVHSVNPKYETLGEPSVSLDDLKRFRQLDSKCPGHPEYRWTAGVECTTGPLGTGYATSVGMAMASKWQAAHFNRPGFDLFDFDVYAIGGDGCMMEGVAQEAASLAGHLQLDNLCWIYDNNEITIEGSTSLAFCDDIATKFIGLGWNVTRVGDANDRRMLARAFGNVPGRAAPPDADHRRLAGSATGRPRRRAPTARTVSRSEPRRSGAPSGSTAGPRTRTFLVPDEVYEHVRATAIGARSRRLREEWEPLFAAYRLAYPELATELEHMQQRTLPEGWDADIPDVRHRRARGWPGVRPTAKVLNAVAGRVPWLLGGSADLAPVDQDAADLRRGGGLLRDRSSRPQPALRRA